MHIRNLIYRAAGAVALAGIAGGAQAAICPTTGNTNSDCGYILTIAANGTVSGSPVNNANPYDGSDDALIGIVNNMTTAFTGSITLSGSGNGGGLFAFDGDGICTFISASFCSTSAFGYAGPNNTFTGINGAGTVGTVVFNVAGGVAAGGSSYFSLEGSPASIRVGVGGVPEPGTWAMMLLGFAFIGGALRVARAKPNLAALSI